MTHLAVAQWRNMIAIDLRVPPFSQFGQCSNLRTSGNASDKAKRVTSRSRVGEPAPMFLAKLDMPAFGITHISSPGTPHLA